MKKNKAIIITIIACIIVGAAAFYGGMKYDLSKASKKNSTNGNYSQFQEMRGSRSGGARMGGMRGGMVNGEIIKKDDTSITIKSADGGSKIIFFSNSTSINKSVDGSKDDLAEGKNVMISGSANSDGSITAQLIQLRPDRPQQFQQQSQQSPEPPQQ